MILQSPIQRHLNTLGVNDDELEIARMHLVQQGCDDRIDTDRLTLTRGTGDQQVGHFREIGTVDVSNDGLPHGDRQPDIGIVILGTFDDRTESHHRGMMIRDLNTHGTTPWDRSNDAHALRFQRKSDIIGQGLDLADLDPRRRNELILCDDGSRLNSQILDLDLKCLELLLQDPGIVTQFTVIDVSIVTAVMQQIDGRRLIHDLLVIQDRSTNSINRFLRLLLLYKHCQRRLNQRLRFILENRCRIDIRGRLRGIRHSSGNNFHR